VNRCLTGIFIVRVIGVLLVVLLFGPVVPVRGQLPPIEVQKLRPNLFLVTGANANTVVFVRSTDVVVIIPRDRRPVGVMRSPIR
jgi:hypothetical protein